MPKSTPRGIDGRCVRTMAAIDEFSTQKVKRSGLKRLVSSSSDLAKISEYRSKLRSSVERFEVCGAPNLRPLCPDR